MLMDNDNVSKTKFLDALMHLLECLRKVLFRKFDILRFSIAFTASSCLLFVKSFSWNTFQSFFFNKSSDEDIFLTTENIRSFELHFFGLKNL